MILIWYHTNLGLLYMMVPSDWYGNAVQVVLLVLLLCWRQGQYAVPDQQRAWSQYITNLHKSTIDGHKHNSTMVSDASPGTAALKMNESFIHMAYLSSNRACTHNGYLKHPHLTIIDGDMRWDSGWFWGCFRVGGHRTRNQLGGSQVKKTTPALAAAITDSWISCFFPPPIFLVHFLPVYVI